MNSIIRQHFHQIEARLIESSSIIYYEVIRYDIAHADGKLRIKANLSDGSKLELFEYVAASRGQINLLKYSFHWQARTGKLKRRWDNAPHHPHLPNSPHHIHLENSIVKENLNLPDIFLIIDEIEKALK